MIVNGFNWSGTKVLVTGASGFKGSWLCAALSRLGAQVYGTVRNQHNPLSAWEILHLDRGIVKVHADVSERQDVYDTINALEPDVIFHLAAKALVPVSLRDPRRTFDVNIMGTLNIIEACRKLRVCERLLICSTDHVFGNIQPGELPQGGFREDSRVSYGGPYDTSKAAMELMVRSYHYTYWHELPAIGISRCANVFGFGDTNLRRVIPLFIRHAIGEGPIRLKYRKSGRQFIHVNDAIIGYILAATSLGDLGRGKQKSGRPEKLSPFTPTFHFSIEKYPETDEPFVRMEALAKMVASVCPTEVAETPDCVDFPKDENKIQALNCGVTREQLGWTISKELEPGIRELSEWYRAARNYEAQSKMVDNHLVAITESLKKRNAV